MSLKADSVWLGPLQGPVKTLMKLCLLATACMVLFLIIGNLFLGASHTMKDVLTPSNSIGVAMTLAVAAAALLLGCIYLSDVQGAIETRPTGFFDIISLVLARLSMILTAFVVLVMFYEVISRYVFEKPTLWANELSLWIAGCIFLLSGLYAMQQRSHIRIFVIYDLLPRWIQKAADILSVALIWLFTYLLIWGGFNEALAKYLRWETFGTAWDPPIPATIKPAILIIIVLVAIQALSNLIADWNKEPEHHSVADEIDESEIEMIRRSIKD